MEPITFTAIVASLSAGVDTTSTSKVGESALLDAYQRLKAALRTEFGDQSEVVEAVDMLEKRPGSEARKEVLKEEVERVSADQNPEVRKAAQELLEQVKVQSGGKQWEPSLKTNVLPLEVLSRKESIALLRKHRPDLPEDNVSLNAIAGELGDLLLAVDLAGRYLTKCRFTVTPREYLTQLRSPELLQHRSLQKITGISPTPQEMNVFRTFALSYEGLDTADPSDSLAVAVLARVACFALGEPIPYNLLFLSLDLPEENSEEAHLRAADAISRLAELGLLREQESGSLALHRLLGIFMRTAVEDAEARSGVEKALVKTASALLDKGYPEPLVALLPHLSTVTDVAKEREDEQAAALYDRLGRCLLMTGAYAEARPYLERALKIREKVLGKEHPDTAASLNSLANALSGLGKYQEARSLCEDALKIREKVLGKEHPDTAASLNSLAVLLRYLGQYQEACSYLERALKIREKVLGVNYRATELFSSKRSKQVSTNKSLA